MLRQLKLRHFAAQPKLQPGQGAPGSGTRRTGSERSPWPCTSALQQDPTVPIPCTSCLQLSSLPRLQGPSPPHPQHLGAMCVPIRTQASCLPCHAGGDRGHHGHKAPTPRVSPLQLHRGSRSCSSGTVLFSSLHPGSFLGCLMIF